MSPSSDADIGRRLARSFDRAVAERTEGAMSALREETVALATAFRATTLQPERAVILLKAMLRGHGSAGWAPSIAAGREVVATPPDALVYETLFAWWVDAYYQGMPADAALVPPPPESVPA